MNNIWIVGLCMHITECMGTENATNTVLSCKKKDLFNLRLKKACQQEPLSEQNFKQNHVVKLAGSSLL